MITRTQSQQIDKSWEELTPLQKREIRVKNFLSPTDIHFKSE